MTMAEGKGLFRRVFGGKTDAEPEVPATGEPAPASPPEAAAAPPPAEPPAPRQSWFRKLKSGLSR
ncbi:MAG: signal recognition particle-docking protein FtsY, partial [Bauldia sp.]|nr:signal recognition particle-docking protein FtsY [Bauldia sp.]